MAFFLLACHAEQRRRIINLECNILFADDQPHIMYLALASPNRSSMESIMLWSWTSASLMSFMEASAPEASMRGDLPCQRKGYVAHKHRQNIWPAVAHERVSIQSVQ